MAGRRNRYQPGHQRPATDAEIKVLASTLRLRILRVCLGEPRTNREIAEVLDKNPASTLHHVRRLVDHGFLEALPVRRGQRGSREIPYIATGKSWSLSTPARDRVLVDTFLEELALVPVETVHTTRMGLQLDVGSRDEFEQRVHDLIEEYAARPHVPGGEAFSVFVAVHPDPNRASPTAGAP